MIKDDVCRDTVYKKVLRLVFCLEYKIAITLKIQVYVSESNRIYKIMAIYNRQNIQNETVTPIWLTFLFAR